MTNSVIVPEGVICPILLPILSANQRLPSGPAVIEKLLLEEVGIVNSVIVPEGVILPTLLAVVSINQTLPSGPAVMPKGKLLPVGVANSVTVPRGRNFAYLMGAVLRKPDIAVGAGGNTFRRTGRGSNRELADYNRGLSNIVK